MRHHRNFKIVGPIKLPWAKMVVGVNEGVYVSICSDVMGMDKILAPKWDMLEKHKGQHKVKRNMAGGLRRVNGISQRIISTFEMYRTKLCLEAQTSHCKRHCSSQGEHAHKKQ
jgi:hypothetical protein